MSFQRTLLKWKIIGFYILEVFVFRVFCNNCCIKLWMHNFYMSLLLGHQLVIEFNAYKERLLEEIFDVCSARDRRKTISFVFHARVLGQYHLLSWLLNYYYAPCSRGGGIKQWCIAKNGGGYTQRAVEKGLKVPCLFMITVVSICCQKNLEVGIRCIPAYTPQYTTGIKWCCDLSVCLFVCPSHLAQLGVQCLGQATWAVHTADPSAHGRRSAVMGGGISSHHAITC